MNLERKCHAATEGRKKGRRRGPYLEEAVFRSPQMRSTTLGKKIL
jgi:hypothetical protein